MKHIVAIVLGLAAVVSLGGCAVERSQNAATARQQMIGMSQEQVLSCMGIPSGKDRQGKTEVWAYNSGGGTDTTGAAYGQSSYTGQAFATPYGATAYGSGTGSVFGSSHTRARYCVVNVVFSRTKVIAVNYTGRTGNVLDPDEQCAYAVQSCLSHPTKPSP
jgi:hypothetical protein